MATAGATRSSFIDTWSAILRDSLQRAGLDSKKVAEISEASCCALRKRFAGLTVYVASGVYDAEKGVAAVHALKSQGLSVKEIATRRGITPQRVYQLLAKNPAHLKAKGHKRSASPQPEK